jgi:hypothetical protein
MQQRQLPHDHAAPVVSAKDRALEPERVEQTDQVARQVVDVVVLDPLRALAPTVAALVGGDRAEASGRERGKLVAPGVGELGEAGARHRESSFTRAWLKIRL